MSKLCNNCGIENKDESNYCKNCGNIINEEIKQNMTKNITYPNKIAIAGLICSLFGFSTFGLCSIIGLILSIIGLSESKKNKEPKGLAIAGIIISSTYILIIIILTICFIAYMNIH